MAGPGDHDDSPRFGAKGPESKPCPWSTGGRSGLDALPCHAVPAPPTRLRDAIRNYVATSKIVASLVVLLPGLGVLLVTLGQDHENKKQWALLVSGVVVGIFGAALQFGRERWRKRITEVERTEADRFRVAVQDAFQPVAELIAGMPSMSKTRREARLKEVCQQAVGALRLLLKDVDRLRAAVYALNESADEMSCIAYHGRGEKPRPFEKNSQRGDSALKMVKDGGNLFVRDLETEPIPVHYRGSGAGYLTFISASISTGEAAFGMVTVDAPTAGTLVGTDQQIVMLIADLLAIAFAEAVR
jgi:hypothetical protein